ncbi:MAG: type I-E CRISPR-associated protein Cas5/CasD [Xanthomonadales bacterium]|nr:type I-E CRISPR-associated protein Cas5/CasD [Xanthomonadales bacterium]
MNPYLLLWLEAPLQAWGHDSRFGRRDSLDFPTKSGVLGLLCCARGAGGEERDWLAAWADLDMQLEAFVPRDHAGKPLPRQPLLRDFHMVGSGYDDADPWQNLLIPKTSEGKKPNGAGTKMTYRYYLQDIAFAVALEAPAEHVDSVVSALQSPAWDLYLGRKNCVPTELIFQGVHASAADALAAGRLLAAREDKRRAPAFRVLQGEHDGELVTLNDVPLQLGPDKRYRERLVTVQRAELTDGG